MKKIFYILFLMPCFLFLLSGCVNFNEKSTNVSIIYGTIALFSLILLLGFCFLVYEKNSLFFFLFSSVFIVNLGYYLLSVSKTLENALFANGVSYLGSVFLPMIMLLIIMKECKIIFQKWFVIFLFIISILIFLLAISPGHLDVYYKSVSLATVNGVSVLEKVYGPLHIVYLFYLLFYFSSMVGIIIYARVERKIEEAVPAIILACSVFVNICVWFFEQLVKIDFELLSVSYIITEIFLLGIHLLLQEKEFEKNSIPIFSKNDYADNTYTEKNYFNNNEKSEIYDEYFLSLTPTEKIILNLHLSGKKTREIMEELCITENTVKFHNKNIYRKFGVSSKKQLLDFINNKR